MRNKKLENKNSIIGQPLFSVPNKQKAYFNTDKNDIITAYKTNVCIDRAELKASLSKEELEGLIKVFDFTYQNKRKVSCVKLASGYYRYKIIFDLTNINHTYIEFIPNEKYNLKIQLQSKFTTNYAGNDSLILKIINDYPFFITRLDVAFDYNTPFNQSAYLKNHGNKRQKNYGQSSNYGSAKNRNKKVLESHYKREITDKFDNRVEVKFHFDVTEKVTFANIELSKVAIALKKELFIPHLQFSNFYQKRVDTLEGKQLYTKLLVDAKEVKNENYIKEMLVAKNGYTTVRNNFKACRDEIEQKFLENSHMIFDFLLPAESIEQRYEESLAIS